MGISDDMNAHLQGGLTTLARAWVITRRDGRTYGFTDHDVDLEFDGVAFRADTGLTAAALEQSTGLSVDNSEALGALSDASISEEEIEAGRFDGAEVVAWLLNWENVEQRTQLFRGTIGEMRRSGGAFQAELRGLTEALNRPVGRVYQKPCTAILGDSDCGFDLGSGGYSSVQGIDEISDRRVFSWDGFDEFEAGWFARGRLTVTSGAANGLTGLIKNDKFIAGKRVVELWEPIRAEMLIGDQVHLVAGCDKRFETCRLKFANLLNFQGFPDIPGDDWLLSFPSEDGSNAGGSLRS
jgi:uncharacterized phage protein (TIGR02218 family)